ncbi:hypothetical protein [Frankia sp. Cppng1_Ct_nod]|uniref:hypothetical protein n=1 Tax=Frankia sp. Cppng1_Ct_nod TaxID=2897162 RepID=UPI001041413F|nr:hypothetical protein [Frankia sp. Cppng1_Ct_nod]
MFDARNGRKCPVPVGVEYVQDSALKSAFNGPLLAPALEKSAPRADEVRDENGFTKAEHRLRDRLSSRVIDISTCSPGINEEKAGIAAALNCATRSEGPVRRPLIINFEAAAGYNAFVRMRRAMVLETGNCGSGGSHNGSWSRRGKLMGTLMCYPGDSRYRIFWTYDSARVAVYASAVDTPNGRKILFDWWQRSVSIFG